MGERRPNMPSKCKPEPSGKAQRPSCLWFSERNLRDENKSADKFSPHSETFPSGTHTGPSRPTKHRGYRTRGVTHRGLCCSLFLLLAFSAVLTDAMQSNMDLFRSMTKKALRLNYRKTHEAWVKAKTACAADNETRKSFVLQYPSYPKHLKTQPELERASILKMLEQELSAMREVAKQRK